MAVALPAGKLRNLMILADETGRFKLMAIDQRTSLRRSAVGGRGTIKAARQQDNQLHLDFEDSGTWRIQTAEPTPIAMWLENTKGIHGIVGTIFTP
jgi:hypothetical protein